MTLQDLEQYAWTYKKSVYRLVASGRSAPSQTRLDEFEKSIDFEFPQEFREFTLSPFGGLCVEVCQDLWDRPIPDGSPDWLSLYNVKVFGIAIGVPEWLDLRRELAALPEQETDLVPFMARGDEAERYCFDLDGQIIRWSPLNGERQTIEGNFYDLLMAEISALEKRYEHKTKAGRPKKPRASRKTRS